MRIQPGEELGEKEHCILGRGSSNGYELAHSRRLWKNRWQEFGVERGVVGHKFEEVGERAVIGGLIYCCKGL